jgi:glutathione S-transferase
MTLQNSIITAELREVFLADKPSEMLAHSSKATVPVLVLENGVVLDESLKIMRWVLQQSDPEHWVRPDLDAATKALIEENDGSFKVNLDYYKYWDRYPLETQQDYRAAAVVFLCKLERRLEVTDYLLAMQITLADIAIFPFIRQFAFVDKQWFDQSPYPQLRRWLQRFLESELFLQSMRKQVPWQEGDKPVLFPC